MKKKENEQIEENGSKKKSRPYDRLIKIVIVLAAIGCLSFGIITVVQNKSYQEYDVLSTVQASDTIEFDYDVFLGKLVKYSKDGVSYLDASGKPIWTESFSMKTPRVSFSENYIVVGDLKGNSVYVFDKNGKISNFATPYPIADLEVANQGVVGAVLEDESGSYIELYDKLGDRIIEAPRKINDVGYPVDIGISLDGEKMVVSYIAMDGITAKNTVAFYNFGSVGQNTNANRLVGSWDFEDTIIPKVEFLDNNTVCAYGDNQAVLYSMGQKPSEKIVIPFETEISSVFSNSRYIGFISQNTNIKEEGKYLIQVYNKNGRRIFEQGFNTEYNSVKFDDKDIIIVSDHECTIYNINGNQKFYSSFGKSLKNIIPNGNRHEYIILYQNETQIIKIK